MKWIKLSDKWPEDGQKVLISNGHIITAAIADLMCYSSDTIWWANCHWSGEWEWDFNHHSITHWMPLPELPGLPNNPEAYPE